MKHSNENTDISQVDAVLKSLSQLPIIKFPEIIPDGLEVEVDRSRAIYVLEGEKEVQEYTYFQQGQFVTKPKAMLLRGEPLITFEVEFGHYSYKYVWFQKQVAYFHSYTQIHDNGKGICILGKRGKDNILAQWKNGTLQTGQLSTEAKPNDSKNTQTSLKNSDLNPKTPGIPQKNDTRVFLYGFAVSFFIFLQFWYWSAKPKWVEYQEIQQIPASNWVPARLVKGSCSVVGRGNRASYSLRGPEGVFRETIRSKQGKSCPDETMSFEVAPFRDGWISRYKAEHSFPTVPLLISGFLLSLSLLFGGVWLWLRKSTKPYESKSQ